MEITNKPIFINLEKTLEEGSLRWIGQNYSGLEPQKLVIAGMGIKLISEVLGFESYKIGRFKIEDAFIVMNNNGIAYIYVNPNYKYYRSVFRKIIPNIPNGYDIDHVLAKNLAKYFEYKYVLLCMVPLSVNRKHGRFEKIKISKDSIITVPEICFADERIYNKILFRNPKARQTLDLLFKGYSPEDVTKYGLTLKQKGIWNTSFAHYLADKEYISKRTTPIILEESV